jgi:lipopolysaccharide/colanic/teichoic acid biosynthesis glycosyltransferase
VEGVPLAETETFDDEIVAGAGVRSTTSPQRAALHLESTVDALTYEQALAKRCVDVLGAALGLLCLAPVCLVIAMLVALDSPGPVLFPQTRVGLRGRTFRMLKFRTMYEGADDEKDAVAELNQAEDSRLFKIPSDPRVTRLGRVLRRWSLDELPQLYNVLMGDMSLVGPRPFFESDLDDYEAHHFRRLSVPAGLTGLWQISGRSDIVDFEEVVRLDRHYIENWSLAMDFRILARTLPAVVSRRGAY